MKTRTAWITRHASWWFAAVLLLVNGVAWAYALAPGGAVVTVEPQLAPDLADLRARLSEGGHGGESFRVEVTDEEAAQTIAWYLSNHPRIPFRSPQVSMIPGDISATGVAEIAGLRVPLRGNARVVLHAGVPEVTLVDLDVGGVAIPAFVRARIQSEIDAQFALAHNLPVSIERFDLKEGKAIVEGVIR